MSEHELPDDPARWPSDPFELLGIERGASPKDARRNYTRLIKTYKPEHHPEQFRRIREAYEAVVRSIEWMSRFGGEVVETRAETPTPSNDQPPANPSEPRSIQVDVPSTSKPTWVDEAGLLWERACEGLEAEAYRGLKALHDSGQGSTAISLRLYWLLALDPSHDPDRHPCDWLLEALRNSGAQGSAFELYRREVEADPGEAVHARFDQLLTLEAPPPTVAELYAWRWAAVRKIERWDVVAADLPVARRRFFGAEETYWLRLILIAADGAAWIRRGELHSELWRDLEQEIKQLAHLGTRFHEWFDQFDYLSTIRQEWQAARSVFGHGNQLLDLLATGWHAPLEDYRTFLLTTLARLAEHPVDWLRYFDDIRREYPAVFSAISEVLHGAYQQAEPVKPVPASQIARLTSEFIASFHSYEESFRFELVEYCCREWIDPFAMVQALADNMVQWRSELSPEVLVGIADDWPVRLVCLAFRLFWQLG